MATWIRAQDGALVNLDLCNGVAVRQYYDHTIWELRAYQWVGLDGVQSYDLLGVYRTEQAANDALDLIWPGLDQLLAMPPDTSPEPAPSPPATAPAGPVDNLPF